MKINYAISTSPALNPSAHDQLNIGSKRILIVDDEDSLREALVAMLSWYGHEVESASDGSKAYEAFLRKPFDVIIAGSSMPDIGGLEFAAKIKSIRRGTRVILLNSWRDPGESSTRKFVDSMLSKPVTIKNVLETLYSLFSPKIA
jgi:CheY-like chemotaxis protein